jgi:hypothetical protein
VKLNKFILFEDNKNKIASASSFSLSKITKKNILHFIEVFLFIGHKTHDTLCQKDVPPLYNLFDPQPCFSYLTSSDKKYVAYNVIRFLCVYISFDRTQKYRLPSRTTENVLLFSVFFFLPAAKTAAKRICFFFTVVGISSSYQYLNHRTGTQSMSMVLNS